MVKRYILPLYDRLATLENVGGKGMSLSKLIEAGIPVPDGFHVTTAAYIRYVNDNNIGSSIVTLITGADPNDTAELEAISQKIGELFAKGEIPLEIEKEIASSYRHMDNTPVAVRSSGTAEDLPGASFAGQHETYLNIQGTEAVLSAIKRCWASLWTARAISYRLSNDIEQDTVSLAVVVQRLIFSDSSGVMFTANPTNGKRNEILISSAWGLGEAIVSSLVTPDTAVVDKNSNKVLLLDIADKQIMTVRTANGSEEKPVDKHIRKKVSLTKEQIINLATLGQSIEKYYGMPMDVEWALENGKFYIVQARPITVLPPEWKLPEKGVYYTKGSLAEHLPNPATPLFATLGLDSANKAAKVLWSHMFGKSMPKLLPQNGAYTTINGYVYLSCVYKPLLIIAKSFSPRSIREGAMNSVPRYKAAKEKFVKEASRWENIQPKTLSASELLNNATQLFDAASNYFTKIQLCLPAAMGSETMLRKFFNKAAERNGITDMSIFLVGFETASLKAEKSLYEIAMWVKQNSKFTQYIIETPAKKIVSDIDSFTLFESIALEVFEEWKLKMQKHLAKYGSACYEYDFAISTPLEDPLPIIESIKTFVSGEGKNPFDRQKMATQKRQKATETMLNQISGPRKWLFKKLLSWAQQTGAMREDAIYYMGMAHPLVRQLLEEIALRLVHEQAIAQTENIYWLKKQELEMLIHALEQNCSLPCMTETISSRKIELEQRRKFVSPHTLPEKATSSTKSTKPVWKNGKLVLTGIGTSTGVITARACVLGGPEDFEKFKQGDILIAVTTTPAWTPLFASAGAVVTDIGGPLSHSSIVAREYGIPAVMAVNAATHTIKSGQMVTVDGGKGTVTIYE